MKVVKILLTVAAMAAGTARTAQSQIIAITEWMYEPIGTTSGEFVEISNIGGGIADMTGWSFDDSSRSAGSLSLSSLGSLGDGESALITELAAEDFRTEWNLPASVKIVGNNTQNLDRSDEINIYNGSTLVDRLTYDDEAFGGDGSVNGPRTRGASASAAPRIWRDNHAYRWQIGRIGDPFGTYASASGDLGSPGTNVGIPEPSSLALGLLAVSLAMRRRSHGR